MIPNHDLTKAFEIMTRKQKRFAVILGLGAVVVLSVALILNALRDQIVFFYSPTELIERPTLATDAIRIGGLVEDGSWIVEGSSNIFAITDGTNSIMVTYRNLVPDLFREGQGVIAEGSLQADGTFLATNVLAKHDENFIPKEVEAAMKAQGVWKGEGEGYGSGSGSGVSNGGSGSGYGGEKQ